MPSAKRKLSGNKSQAFSPPVKMNIEDVDLRHRKMKTTFRVPYGDTVVSLWGHDKGHCIKRFQLMFSDTTFVVVQDQGNTPSTQIEV